MSNDGHGREEGSESINFTQRMLLSSIRCVKLIDSDPFSPDPLPIQDDWLDDALAEPYIMSL
jgi:hypothetical protein